MNDASSIISEHLDLPFILAKKRAGHDYGEYVTSGYIGLTRAAESFDPRQGRSFRSHAFQKIDGAILDQMREDRGRSLKRGRGVRFASSRVLQFVSAEPIASELESGDEVKRLSRDLTSRQAKIARMLADGMLKQDIARKLKCDPTLISIEVKKIRRTLQDATRATEGALP